MNILPVKKSSFETWLLDEHRAAVKKRKGIEEKKFLSNWRESSDPSCVSMKSDRSKDWPLKFNGFLRNWGESSDPSCVSMKSDRSKDLPLKFNSTDEAGSKTSDLSCVRLMDLSVVPRSSQTSGTGGEGVLSSIFQLLKENIFSFVENQLDWFQKVLSTDSPDILWWLCGENETADKKIWSSRDAFLSITLDFMRTMNLQDLGNSLQNKLHLIVGGTSEDISEASSQRDQPSRSFMTILADAFGNRLKKRKA